MSKVKISVLMCLYNAEDFVEQAINSIIDQSFNEWELLIGDDCSTDRSLEIAEHFASKDDRIKIFKNDKNLGYLLNTNSLWHKAQGNYITFQDADDWSDKNRLTLQYNFIREKQIDICSSNFMRVNLKGIKTSVGSIEAREKLTYSDLYSEFARHRKLPVFTGSLFLNKKVSDEVGMYKSFFSRKCGEDADWILRASRSFKVGTLPEILYFYRENPRGVTQNISIDSLVNNDLIFNIHEKYINYGIDLLEDDYANDLIQIETRLKRKYVKDISSVYYEKVKNGIYHQLWLFSLKNILLAIKAKPFRSIYYRTLFFILKSSLKVKSNR
ncbi:glycosyltransferase family 2 protein [Nubsella zeaxanthinifaciens]|uniref:glycosyltransferase family 2 protein n=1 Tax=Nubsella zeaxanthinifaciens TaxID=392412 RepID=UPI000DE52CBF|nr:glycosyltransferase family 2 protein [Nubsella zeaxanthinifaciens]